MFIFIAKYIELELCHKTEELQTIFNLDQRSVINRRGRANDTIFRSSVA